MVFAWWNPCIVGPRCAADGGAGGGTEAVARALLLYGKLCVTGQHTSSRPPFAHRGTKTMAFPRINCRTITATVLTATATVTLSLRPSQPLSQDDDDGCRKRGVPCGHLARHVTCCCFRQISSLWLPGGNSDVGEIDVVERCRCAVTFVK